MKKRIIVFLFDLLILSFFVIGIGRDAAFALAERGYDVFAGVRKVKDGERLKVCVFLVVVLFWSVVLLVY